MAIGTETSIVSKLILAVLVSRKLKRSMNVGVCGLVPPKRLHEDGVQLMPKTVYVAGNIKKLCLCWGYGGQSPPMLGYGGQSLPMPGYGGQSPPMLGYGGQRKND